MRMYESNSANGRIQMMNWTSMGREYLLQTTTFSIILARFKVWPWNMGSRSLYTIYQKTLNEWNLTEMWTLFQKLIIY